MSAPEKTDTRPRAVVAGLLMLSGAGLLTAGAWLIYHPAALVVAGVLLLVEGVAEARR